MLELDSLEVAFELANLSIVYIHRVLDAIPLLVDLLDDDLVLTVNSCIKVRLDLQADKSPVVVKGPFFPRVVNPRYRIR
jgi:hypothetical protein